MIDKHAELVCELVRTTGRDLSLRQMAVFFQVYLNGEKQTVKGLAENLKVSKPAVTRALDRLEAENLVVREVNTQDRRQIFAGYTSDGKRFLTRLTKLAA